MWNILELWFFLSVKYIIFMGVEGLLLCCEWWVVFIGNLLLFGLVFGVWEFELGLFFWGLDMMYVG